MARWLVKTEPEAYSFARLLAEGRTAWDGVRNPEARRNLAAMREGELCLVYHSVSEKAVVGVARVIGPARPDPTDGTGRWLAVDMAPVATLPRPVPLAAVRADPALAHLPLVTRSRLSVMPVDEAAFVRLLALGGLEAVPDGG